MGFFVNVFDALLQGAEANTSESEPGDAEAIQRLQKDVAQLARSMTNLRAKRKLVMAKKFGKSPDVKSSDEAFALTQARDRTGEGNPKLQN